MWNSHIPVWRPAAAIPAAALEQWSQVLGSENFSIDEGELDGYTALQPAGSYWKDPPAPQAIARPRSTEEVSKVLRIANEHAVPVVTIGGGTSLEGNTMFVHGGLCLDLRNFDEVIQLHEDDMEVTVQAAVPWMSLNELLAPKALMLGVDPGPGAHIGGMVATNCSGPHAFRWGMMRQHVVNVTAVLADGTILRTRQRPKKTSAGYDLTGLIVGSEGTLAVVTEITMRLQRVPPCIEVARVSFPSVRKAAEAVFEIKRAALPGLLCCELLCGEAVRCVNAFSGTSLAEETTLLLKFAGASASAVAAEIQTARGCCEQYTDAAFLFSQSVQEREQIWHARKAAGWATAADVPGRRVNITDTAVPLSRVADYIEAVERLFQQSWLSKVAGPNKFIAHLGDGNVHCVFPFDPDSDLEATEAVRLNKAIVHLALGMEGTCTGEHGVGYGKRSYLQEELGESAVLTMQRIKDAMDPKGILNPGKVLPDRSE